MPISTSLELNYPPKPRRVIALNEDVTRLRSTRHYNWEICQNMCNLMKLTRHLHVFLLLFFEFACICLGYLLNANKHEIWSVFCERHATTNANKKRFCGKKSETPWRWSQLILRLFPYVSAHEPVFQLEPWRLNPSGSFGVSLFWSSWRIAIKVTYAAPKPVPSPPIPFWFSAPPSIEHRAIVFDMRNDYLAVSYWDYRSSCATGRPYSNCEIGPMFICSHIKTCQFQPECASNYWCRCRWWRFAIYLAICLSIYLERMCAKNGPSRTILFIVFTVMN